MTSLLSITSSLIMFTCNYVELRWRFRVSSEQIFSASAYGMFPCLFSSCSVLQTRFRVFNKNHMFPYVSPDESLLFSFSPSPYRASFVSNPCDRVVTFCFFRSYFSFFQQPQQSLPVVTSSGRIHPVAVNDHVFLVEDLQYRVTKIFPEEGSFRLQKIKCRDCPFKRSLKQIWLPLPATCEVSVTADLPTANCICPEPIPPQILPDTSDSAVQVDLPQCDAMDEWVSLMTDNSSVDNLEKTVSEAPKQLEQSQLHFRSSQQTEAALHSQVASLTNEIEHLRSRLQDLTDTHNDLMNQSMAQIETIGSLRSQLTKKSSTAEPILRLLRQLLVTLPTDFDDDHTPDDTLYHFLCCALDADTATLSGRANLLLKCLHPDNSPTPEDPLVQASGRSVTLITLMKRTLTTPALRQVYDHSGLEGLRRLLRSTLRCPRCTPSAPDGFSAPQERLEYPQLELLLSYGT